MTTLDLHPWNLMSRNILAHVFSFLPVRDRHNVSCVCKLWAAAVSSRSVWSFTEVHCDLEETDDEQEEDDGSTSNSLLQKVKPYMGHIRYLKLVLDMPLDLTQRLACAILDVMALKSHRLQGIQIVCYGGSHLSSSSENVLNSLQLLFWGLEEPSMQHVDFQKMPFIIENKFISLMANWCPDLRTLLINNRGATMVRRKTIVKILRCCPKLSTLGVIYFALSRKMFQELLRPNREPFKLLDLFHDGFENDISDDCWISLRERHPGLRVRLEFAATVPREAITRGLKPHMSIFELRFNSFNHMATLVYHVSKLYAGTLEKLVLHSGPFPDSNMALIELARACVHLKEIHCFCEVSEGVVDAFRRHCPHLEKYTLSPTLFLCDKPTSGKVHPVPHTILL